MNECAICKAETKNDWCDSCLDILIECEKVECVYCGFAFDKEELNDLDIFYACDDCLESIGND